MTTDEEKVVDDFYLDRLKELMLDYHIAITSVKRALSDEESEEFREGYGTPEQRFETGLAQVRASKVKVKEMLK